MTIKTRSEVIFEEFCSSNNIPWVKIAESNQSTPDYKVILNSETVIVEIKQIDKCDELTEVSSTRIVGDHIRERVKAARAQMKVALKERLPAILLIYNDLDPMQMFGTEQHDFIAAMYGEPTGVLNIKENRIKDSYCGRNQSLRRDKNTSYSALGLLYQTNKGPVIRLYKNVFAENKLNYISIPKCIEIVRIEID